MEWWSFSGSHICLSRVLKLQHFRLVQANQCKQSDDPRPINAPKSTDAHNTNFLSGICDIFLQHLDSGATAHQSPG